MKKPILIGMFGYPGSGKTHFSKQLGKKEHWVHLSADTIRSMIFTEPMYTREEHTVVFSFMDYLTEEFLRKGISVIYDANCNKKESRRKLSCIAKKTGAFYSMVWVQVSESIAIKRVKKRKKIKHALKNQKYGTHRLAVFKKLKGEMELPSKSEPVIALKGNDAFVKQFSSFKTQLSEF